MLRSEQLRQVSKLQSQLEKDGLTLAVYDQQGKEVDVEEALGSMKEAEKLANDLGLEMVFRNPTTGIPERRSPQTKGVRKKSPARKVDGRTRYSNALKRIMKEHGCDRKEAQKIYSENQQTAQGGTKKTAKKKVATAKKKTAKKAAKKKDVSAQKEYVQRVKAVQKEHGCSYREAQEILKAA